MTKRALFFLLLTFGALGATAQQRPMKPRPDAFPPVEETLVTKSISMATTVEEMSDWDRYPTYTIYLKMMQRWAETYPTLCHIDTIGTSVQGRLILSMYIDSRPNDNRYRPEFFYSATIHGDELTGYVMMLHLIDTLLAGYGTNEQYTSLLDRTRISINPLANPDGTYKNNENNVRRATRYNANNVDLNRNYPDPFAQTKTAIEPENEAMIAYLTAHQFRLSANLHGGAEVMNYPWDSFTSKTVRHDADQMSHPAEDWWIEVCKRFVDTSWTYNESHFRDTYTCGYTAGGDWYPISGGRQDYVNAVHNCLELTMEVSSEKTPPSEQLPEYWNLLQHSLVNYIDEIHNLPENIGIGQPQLPVVDNRVKVYPNPTQGTARVVTGEKETLIDLSGYPTGIYYIKVGDKVARVIKN